MDRELVGWCVEMGFEFGVGFRPVRQFEPRTRWLVHL